MRAMHVRLWPSHTCRPVPRWLPLDLLNSHLKALSVAAHECGAPQARTCAWLPLLPPLPPPTCPTPPPPCSPNASQALRDLWKPAEEFAKKHRTPLSMFSTANLAFIVWQTLSGARDLLFEQRATMIISVMVLASFIHVFFLLINWAAVWCVEPRARREATQQAA